MRRQTVVLLAVGAAAVVVAALVARPERRAMEVSAASSTSTSLARSTTTTTWTSSSTTTTTGTPTTTGMTTTTVTMGGTPLRPGSFGPAVASLEEALSGLGFWLGAPDDSFDNRTAHAVTAFQKLHGLRRDGIVDEATARAVENAQAPVPRSTTGVVLEVDLAHQVLLVADQGATVAVLDVSTGRWAGATPEGQYRITRQIDGYRRAPLGVLYRPKYWSEGVAFHGYPSVPAYPASHGCVRLINAAMDWLWSSGFAPVGTEVWSYR